MKKKYDLAYSSCPNDTFIFKGIARKLIDTKGLGFNIIHEDVETLNQNAAQERYHITKLSVAAFGSLLDRYALLRTGAALGKGCGPLIISLSNRQLDDTKQPIIAVPGMGTTAYHLFCFYMADRFPDITFKPEPMPFEKIMPAVQEGSADFGVIIHEGRFIYQNLRLDMKADLGQWWEDTTNLPIPLGCIAVHRSIDPDTACIIQSLIQESIAHAWSHPDMEQAYIKQFAQEMDNDVIQQHINLYVNEFSKDIGEQGTLAITTFFDYAQKAGLMNPADLPLFAC